MLINSSCLVHIVTALRGMDRDKDVDHNIRHFQTVPKHSIQEMDKLSKVDAQIKGKNYIFKQTNIFLLVPEYY